MHEYSLVSGAMEMVLKESVKHGIKRVTRVCLVVGEYFGALPEALQFAFAALCSGTIMEGARLEIKEEPILCTCKECQGLFSWQEYKWQCPHCGGLASEIKGGKDIRIEYFEGEEEDGNGGAGAGHIN